MRPIVSTLHTANGSTSLGTSTTKTQLGGANLILPAWARSILAIVPFAVLDVITAAESLIPQFDVESNDLKVQPFQVLGAPIGATLSSSVSTFAAKPEKYLMGTPCNGGEQISVYGTALVANTSAPYAGATLVVSNMPAGHRQRHAKTGTLTSSGATANSDVAGTRYNFSGAKHLIELMGIVAHTTVAAAAAINGYFKFTSNEFDGVADVKLPINPISGGLGVGQLLTLIDGVSRIPVDIPVFDGQVNVQDYLYMGLAPGTAGNFITGVVYE